MNYFSVQNNQKGFALLFSVLITSVILAISIGISLITLREVKLSGIVRDGTYAVYAANSGYECGVYYDGQSGLANSPFAGSSGVGGISFPMNCGQTGAVTMTQGNDGVSDYTQFEYDTQAGTCTKVKVSVSRPIYDPVSGNSPVGTLISARGYNESCAQTANNDSNLTERLLEASYTYTP